MYKCRYVAMDSAFSQFLASYFPYVGSFSFVDNRCKSEGRYTRYALKLGRRNIP